MNYYYITFRSITGAQKAESLFSRAGIGSQMLRTPKNMITEGCGYALKVRDDRAPMAMRLLSNAQVNYGKVFLLKDDSYSEVIL